MNGTSRREIVFVDLIGELDVAMSERVNQEIGALDGAAFSTIVVRLERVLSTQWAGLCELASVIARHRKLGVDVRAYSRLRRVGAVLEEFAIPGDVPEERNFNTRRRLIIARTPKPCLA